MLEAAVCEGTWQLIYSSLNKCISPDEKKKKKKKKACWIGPKFILRLHWIKGLDMQRNPTLGFVQNKSSRVMCLLVHTRPQRPRGQEDGLAGDHGGEWVNARSRWKGEGKARRGEAEESKSKPREVFESSGIPLLLRRLLWEASGACGESEVRRGLSGTKLRIHMICLAKRVKEKWIKAWRGSKKNATIKSRRLPWDQQEMHIIYKLFFGSVRCGGNWLLLFGGWTAAGGG